MIVGRPCPGPRLPSAPSPTVIMLNPEQVLLLRPHRPYRYHCSPNHEGAAAPLGAVEAVPPAWASALKTNLPAVCSTKREEPTGGLPLSR